MSSIVIVDDDEHVCAAIAYVLRRDGHDVRAAHTLAAAIPLVRRLRPELVIVDHSLRDATGRRVTAALREVAPTLPIILLTGHDAVGAIGDEHDGLVDRLLRKPFGRGELLDAIAAAAAAPIAGASAA